MAAVNSGVVTHIMVPPTIGYLMPNFSVTLVLNMVGLPQEKDPFAKRIGGKHL
jgi:hypothetical protein